MTFVALALGVAQSQSPTILHARIVSAAIFKPGIVMLDREVEVPTGTGFYALDELPDALDGTFWYGSNDDALVSELSTTIRLEEKVQTYEAKTIPELIYANQGKHLSFKILKGNDPETVSGTLTDLDDRGGLTIKLDGGGIRSLNISQIVELDPTGLTTTYTRKGQVPTLRVQFKATAPKTAHIRFSSLEPGAAWTASYLVDLGANSGSRILGKAQVGLGGLKFENTDTKLMAGYPNLPTSPKFDLASGYSSLDAYLHGNGTALGAYRPGIRDPYDLFPTWVQQMRAALARYGLTNYTNYGFPMDGRAENGFGFGGGGMGGGGFGVAMEGRSGQLLPSDSSVYRSESIYAYPIGSTTLEPGDRLTKLLFEQQSHYRTVYHWDANQSTNSVDELLRIHNDGKTPWTGGAATITKNGLPLAQVAMPFTSTGHDADLVLGQAPDVLMYKDVQEIRAEPIPNPKRPNIVDHTRLTEQTVIVAENSKSEDITIEIVLDLLGDVKTTDAKIEKLPRHYNDLNPKSHLIWSFLLPAGQQKRITVTNVYIR